MKKYDFIIGYESKVREIESAYLLKCELESRGYSVFVYNKSDERMKSYIKKYCADVLVLPYAYADESISSAIGKNIRFNKIINLQWEQAITKYEEDDRESFKNPSGICRQVVHIAWGEANKKRLLNIVGLEEKWVKVCGNMTLDFLRSPLNLMYMSREQVFQKYGIPDNKKICLFIASFKAGTLTEEELDKQCRTLGEQRRIQHVVAKKTLETVLDWIEKILKENKDLYFIYRAHPGERTDLAQRLANRNHNFKIINDLSVKQWILVVDKIYTWYSTSVVEVFWAGKNCGLVYPYELPDELVGRLFENAKTIREYADFKRTIGENEQEFPISQKKIEQYYGKYEKEFSYKKVADVCEQVFSSDAYLIEEHDKKRVYAQYKEKSLQKRISVWGWQFNWVQVVAIKIFKKKYFSHRIDNYIKWKDGEVLSAAETFELQNRIKDCWNKIKEETD